MVDVITRNWMGFKSVRKGEVVRALPEDSAGVEGLIEVKFTGGDLGIIKRSDAKLQASRSPIDAWPDAFIFFERVLGLLRGLTASLEVSQSYFDVMTPYARLALSKYFEEKNSLQSDVVDSHEGIRCKCHSIPSTAFTVRRHQLILQHSFGFVVFLAACHSL